LREPVTQSFNPRPAAWGGPTEASFPLGSVEDSEDLLRLLVFLAVVLRLLAGQPHDFITPFSQRRYAVISAYTSSEGSSTG
jgi:hypothetical protein